MNILLIGIGGVYNYGCEAIVRGTEILLHEKWPEAKIVYASCRPEQDGDRLQDLQIEIVRRYPSQAKKYSVKKIVAKVLSRLNILTGSYYDPMGLLDGIDAVFSVGGDIYTLNSDGSFDATFPKFGELAESKMIPYILWGASVGPFSGNYIAEKFYRDHLSKITMIVAREQLTVDYLNSLGLSSKVVPCGDPAFVVAPEIKKTAVLSAGKPCIGINLSPLSLRYAGLSLSQEINAQAKVIERIVNQFSAKVILIPHVVSDTSISDDDRRYLNQIYQAVDKRYRQHISLVDTDPGFVGVKKILVQVDIVIAARMHCAINALSAHVPTILLAYSQKAEGMCQYVYGTSEWVISVQEFSDRKCMDMIGRMLVEKDIIYDFLSKRIPAIQNDVRRCFDQLQVLRSENEES